jgi:hypothetical protein
MWGVAMHCSGEAVGLGRHFQAVLQGLQQQGNDDSVSSDNTLQTFATCSVSSMRQFPTAAMLSMLTWRNTPAVTAYNTALPRHIHTCVHAQPCMQGLGDAACLLCMLGAVLFTSDK